MIGLAGNMMESTISIEKENAKKFSSLNFKVICAITAVLSSLGIAFISSAQISGDDDGLGMGLNDNILNQIFSSLFLYVVSAVCLLVFYHLAPKLDFKFTTVILIGSILLLTLTFVPGFSLSVNGNRNWVSFGPKLIFQPSEFVKVTLVLYLSKVLKDVKNLSQMAKKQKNALYLKAILPVVIVLAIIFFDGDMGTIVIMALLIFGCLIFSGIRARYIIGAAICFPIFAILYLFLSKGYHHDRFMAVLPGNRLCDGFTELRLPDVCAQQINSKYALANGNLITGVGWGRSSQKWGYLTEKDTDFIFSIIVEETGLIGILLILGCFILLAAFLIRIINRHKNIEAKVCVGGILLWILGQFIINVTTSVGSFPVIGVTLPLVSKGFSSTFSVMLAIALVLVHNSQYVDYELQDLHNLLVKKANLRANSVVNIANSKSVDNSAKLKPLRQPKYHKPNAIRKSDNTL